MSVRLFDAAVYITLSVALTFLVVYLAIEPPAAKDIPAPEYVPIAHNAANPMDVTGDGVVGSSDAAAVMESLKVHRNSLPLPVDQLERPESFVDVDGDGFLTEKDAQAVILHLNKISASSRRSA